MQGFERAAPDYEANAVVVREIRARLLERLDYLAIDPKVVLDLGAASGFSALKLSKRYPRAGILCLDIAPAMIAAVPAADRIRGMCADAAAMPLPDASVDLIFSNLMLPWCDDLDAVLVECCRVLRPHGAFSFATFGPDTLKELRQAWRTVDDYEHVHPFFDMHDIGDALMRAGFAEPVMDVEEVRATYTDVAGLLRDLRGMGSLNALPGRRRGLSGRSALRRLGAAYETHRDDSVLPATFEVVYGQAWGPLPGRQQTRDGVTRIPIDSIPHR